MLTQHSQNGFKYVNNFCLICALYGTLLLPGISNNTFGHITEVNLLAFSKDLGPLAGVRLGYCAAHFKLARGKRFSLRIKIKSTLFCINQEL